MGGFCSWAGLAWAQLWVHPNLVSDGLELLVLLQIEDKEITVKGEKESYSLNQ